MNFASVFPQNKVAASDAVRLETAVSHWGGVRSAHLMRRGDRLVFDLQDGAGESPRPSPAKKA
jgi:hypothetical protein